MELEEPKEYYRRTLPHIQPLASTFFVTYNLFGAVPKEKQIEWKKIIDEKADDLITRKITDKEEWDKLPRLRFKLEDDYLDTRNTGILHLKDPKLAQIVKETLHFWDEKKIELIGYCIMANHVHIIIRLLKVDAEIEKPLYLQEFMQSIKKYSASQCNKARGILGQFWQNENFDRYVRNQEELIRILKYVWNNPVKAQLCPYPEEWQWTYIKAEYQWLLSS